MACQKLETEESIHWMWHTVKTRQSKYCLPRCTVPSETSPWDNHLSSVKLLATLTWSRAHKRQWDSPTDFTGFQVHHCCSFGLRSSRGFSSPQNHSRWENTDTVHWSSLGCVFTFLYFTKPEVCFPEHGGGFCIQNLPSRTTRLHTQDPWSRLCLPSPAHNCCSWILGGFAATRCSATANQISHPLWATKEIPLSTHSALTWHVLSEIPPLSLPVIFFVFKEAQLLLLQSLKRSVWQTHGF